MAALALPLALILGVLSELAGALAARIGKAGRRRARGFGPGGEVRPVWRSRSPRARPTVLEATGAAVSLAGSGLAAAGAIGLIAGSAALVYLGLALGVVGVHLAWPVRDGATGEGATARVRLEAAMAEPAFVLALGAMLLRWRASDFEAIRGAQTVLGPGIALGPAEVAGGLVLAAAAAVLAGALRLGPSQEVSVEGQSQAGGSGRALMAPVARWGATGATAVIVSALVAGHRLDVSAEAALFAGVAILASALAGAIGVLVRVRPAWRAAAAAAALAMAAGGAVLVVAG